MQGAIESLLTEITSEIKNNEIAEAEQMRLVQTTWDAETIARGFAESSERARGRECMAKAASINAQSRRIELEKEVSDDAALELGAVLQGAASTTLMRRMAEPKETILTARAYINEVCNTEGARLALLRDATRDARQRLDDLAQQIGVDDARFSLARMRYTADTAALTRETEIHRGIEARCAKLAAEMQIMREARDCALGQGERARADAEKMLLEAAANGGRK